MLLILSSCNNKGESPAGSENSAALAGNVSPQNEPINEPENTTRMSGDSRGKFEYKFPNIFRNCNHASYSDLNWIDRAEDFCIVMEGKGHSFLLSKLMWDQELERTLEDLAPLEVKITHFPASEECIDTSHIFYSYETYSKANITDLTFKMSVWTDTINQGLDNLLLTESISRLPLNARTTGIPLVNPDFGATIFKDGIEIKCSSHDLRLQNALSQNKKLL